MANETIKVHFKGVILQMRFEGAFDNFEVSSIKFTLLAEDGRVLCDEPAIPVKSLFDLSHVIDLSVRKYEQELKNTLNSMKEVVQHGKEN